MASSTTDDFFHPYVGLPLRYIYKIRPHMSGSHLDFGCGDGKLTGLMAKAIPEARVTGYDISDKVIEKAKTIHKKKQVEFYSDPDFLSSAPRYDSVSLNFVFHETGYGIIPQVSSLIRDQGKVFILDFDMKHIADLTEFESVFITPKDKKEIDDKGLIGAFLEYTAHGLEDCKYQATLFGLRTINVHSFYDKYFLWIGEKQ